MKRWMAVLAALSMCILPAAAVTGEPEVEGVSALLMEKETGAILYERSPHDKLEPASVTKIMTLLLTMEAIDSGALSVDEEIRVSTRASGMGGSQVYLKEGEVITVRDLLKSVAVASGNDAAVALAERVAGSESAFVERMNERARELGMADTTFCNCTGLPAPGHLTSAYDIALMSRELILNHPDIREYTTIWMDSIRDGAFQLSNTNKLVRFYDGCTGLKTGFTAAAGYCMSATAERDGMELIAVVMKSQTSVSRNESAKSMLDFGFANYTVLDVYPAQALPPVDVLLGEKETVQPVLAQGGRLLVERSQVNEVETAVALVPDVEAPVEQGQKLGELTVKVGGEVKTTIPIVAGEEVPRLTIPGIFKNLLERWMMAK